jgi:phage gp29-like protein
VDSLEEFRDRLLDLYSDMDVADLGNLMQRAFVIADLAGRFDAANDAEV